MASMCTQKNGSRRIVISGLLGPRTRLAIRVGKATKKETQRLRNPVKKLTTAHRTGTALEEETIRSVQALLPATRRRLSYLGLIDGAGRSGPRMLGPFVKSHVDGRTKVTPATREVCR